MAFCAAIPTRQILAPNPGRSGAFSWNWIVATVVLALNLSTVRANPAGGSVSHGNATIDQNGNTLTIHQGTDLLIMGWHSFSIGQGETTRFVQPSSSSMALNRVFGGTRSMIEGRLEANGGVILINPAGITVTKSGVVNVNTFIGSTHDITDDEFLKGGALNLKGTSDATIENLGTIHAETGDIALIARTVRNEGTLSAPKGVVGLAAGDEVLYQPNAEERLLVKSQAATVASIHHSGSIQAAAAEIKAAGNPYAVAINLDGIVDVRGNATKSIQPRVIVHAAQGDINVGSKSVISAVDGNSGGLVKLQAATGNLQLDGKVAASASIENGGKGGEIQILGNNITLSGTALLDASGATGGGKIFVGGDYQGGTNPTNHYASEPLQNASTLRIDKGAIMNADATVQGDGGVVINWADGTTISSGSVSVRGGPLGGNGGFVEVSGKRNLGFDGAVDLAAPRGKGGQVLFDPNNIQITSGFSSLDWNTYLEGTPPTVEFGSFEGSQNMSQTVLTGVTSGTITLKANNISLEDWSGNNPATITLQKNVSLVLESQNDRIYLPSGSSITASGTGSVKLDASQSSQLVIHGDITTAAGAITLIAQKNIDLIGSSLKTTGAITLIAAQDFNFGGTISSANGGVTLESYYGNLNLSPGSSITQSGNSGITLLADNGSILGSSALSTPSGWVRLQAPNNNGTMTGEYTVGSVDFSGSINAGSSIDIGAGNEITLNGAVSSVSSSIYFHAGNTITLGTTSVETPTTLSTVNNNVNLTAPSISLNKARISSGGPYGSITIDHGVNHHMLLSSDSLSTVSSLLPGGFSQNLSAQTIYLQAGSVTFSGGEIPTDLSLNRDQSLQVFATTGNMIMPSGSSITASGNGWVNLIAYKDFNFGGTISSVNGGVTLESYYGNLNLSPGSSITQSGNSGITLLADNGSILGSSALSSPLGWISLRAPNNNGSIIENHLVGSLDFSGSINAGSSIDIGAGNEITLNGAVSSSSSSINIRANNAITLGNLDAKLELNTSLNALYDVNLSSPFISLNGTMVTSTSGNIWINTGSQLTLSSDTLATITSTKAGGIFNNLSAQGIYLQANNVSLSDQPIKLPSNENLWIYANSGNLTIPSVSSITASGNGWVNLIAYKDFNFGGTISSVNGGVTLESYYGNLNLSPGSSITQSGNSGITLLADNGSILGSSALSTPSGWVRLQAPNNNGTMTGEYTVGSVDFSGSINAGSSIDIYGGNEITLNGAVSSSSSTVNLRANNLITLGSTPPLSPKTKISTAIVGSAPTTISASGSLYLNAPVLSFINTPVLSAEALSGSFGSINSSSVGLSSSTPLTKGYDGTSAITLLPTDLLINGLIEGYTAGVVSANGTFISPNVQSANAVAINSLVVHLTEPKTTSGDFSLSINNLSLAGSITPATLKASLTGSVSRIYDGTTAAALTSINYLLNGVIGKDTVSLNNPASGTYENANVGTGKNVSVSGLSLDNANYQLESTTIEGAIGVITPATLTAALTGGVSKVYDGNNTTTIDPSLISLSGIVEGKKFRDDVSINSTFTSTYDTANVGIDKTVSLSGLTLTGAMAGNYTLAATLTGSGDITPKTLTAALTGGVSKVYDGTTAAALTSINYLLNGVIRKDTVSLNNPASGTYENANVGTGKNVSVTGLSLDNANYQLESTTIEGAIGAITPATSTAQQIVSEPTVQTAVQNLTIRNNTTTTSSGGSFGSSGPSSESSGSSGESASAGESASSGESSSSESGGETASSESSGESASSSESSTASTDSGSSANTASADASSSSGSTSTANSSSSSATAGSAATSSTSGGSSQGAKTQAAAISRMNNPVGGATVGGAEFHRLNPFSDAGAMHQEVAGASASSGGGTTQTSTGRAAAVSVKSPEMTELAPMNDLNVLFMMF